MSRSDSPAAPVKGAVPPARSESSARSHFRLETSEPKNGSQTISKPTRREDEVPKPRADSPAVPVQPGPPPARSESSTRSHSLLSSSDGSQSMLGTTKDDKGRPHSDKRDSSMLGPTHEDTTTRPGPPRGLAAEDDPGYSTPGTFERLSSSGKRSGSTLHNRKGRKSPVEPQTKDEAESERKEKDVDEIKVVPRGGDLSR